MLIITVTSASLLGPRGPWGPGPVTATVIRRDPAPPQSSLSTESIRVTVFRHIFHCIVSIRAGFDPSRVSVSGPALASKRTVGQVPASTGPGVTSCQSHRSYNTLCEKRRFGS